MDFCCTLRMKNKRHYGECRCCLVKGNHRSLLNEYIVGGKQVFYKDYFLECFNIFLSSNSELTDLICSGCIKQLLKACRFRSRVLKNERRLLRRGRHANETEFVNVQLQPHTIDDGQVHVKQESDCDATYNDFPASPDVHVVKGEHCGQYSQAPATNEDLIPGEKELLSRFSCQPRLPRRDALYSLCPAYYGQLEALKGKIIHANTIDIAPQRTEKRTISQKQAQVLNATALLESSNATAFKTKMRSGFPCFYCRHIFLNPKQLREHQSKHPKSQLCKLLSKYSADALVVYADVTDLKCTICDQSVQGLSDLKTHLTVSHGLKLYNDCEERVIPFKLEDRESHYDCQVCGKGFETFGATERHMNVHYSHYVCEECGAGFVTRRRLKVHTYILHSKNKSLIKCEPCKKTFPSKFKYKIHHESVHKKLKKMKCTKCSEKFIDYFTRQRHMEAKHGVDLLSYKCKECHRTFNRKYSLTCHFKRIHLAAKDVQCELCPFMCFNNSELKEHMYKHGVEKGFECTLCQKAFARKKTLTVHMRMHSGDRSHVCGEAFVQHCAVKAHSAEYAD